MSKNPGKVFENDFKQSAESQGIWTLRLNDTSLSWMKEKNMRFTPNNIADYIVYRYPNLYIIECKSTNSSSIGIQRNPNENKSMIMAHQISDLTNASLVKGIYSVLVLNYRNDEDINDNTVYALLIDKFNNFLVDNDKKSINKQDCIKYGGIVVNQKIKRTHYNYDVVGMLDEIDLLNQKGGTNGKTSV